MAVAADGNVWLTAFPPPDRTLYRIDIATGQVTWYAVAGVDGQGTRNSHGIVVDAAGLIYFNAGNGLGRVDPETDTFEFFTPPPDMAGILAQDLDIAPDGAVWATTRGGAFRFDPAGRTWRRYGSINPFDGATYGVAADVDGNGWWTQFNANRLGKADPRTGEVFEVLLRPPWLLDREDTRTPADAAFYRSIGALAEGGDGGINMIPGAMAPRRMGADRHGEFVYLANFNGEALNGDLDPAAFEACAVAILKRDWPRLVSVRGGSDDGFDAAVADGGRQEPFPVVITTARDLTGNLRRNLLQARRKWPHVDRVLLATSRRITPRLRSRLYEETRRAGVTLVQAYDQDWFAQKLYREPAWCKRLLGITGRPRALSPFPVTRRPVLGDRVLGREREMRWLLDRVNRSRDCLVVGVPGSGKTFLLRALVLQGNALFQVDTDRTQIANDLRELQPPAVIVDDAHVDPCQVERTIHVRQEVGSDVQVIATSWPGRARDVQRPCRSLTPTSIDLDLIDADTMIDRNGHRGAPMPPG